MDRTDIDPHLVREWEQAWSHYRHLESTRSQYLGFFFTVLVASVGLAVGLTKEVPSGSKATVVFGLTLLVFLDFLITIGLFTAIKKMGYVLKRYERIMRTVRDTAGFQSSSELPFSLSDMKDYPRHVLDAYAFSAQRSAEFILGAVSVVLVSVLGSLAKLFLHSMVPFAEWQRTLGVTMALAALVYLIIVFGPLANAALSHRERHDEEPEGGPQP